MSVAFSKSKRYFRKRVPFSLSLADLPTAHSANLHAEPLSARAASATNSQDSLRDISVGVGAVGGAVVGGRTVVAGDHHAIT